MAKSKIIAIAASAALVAMLGLCACGGQSASSSAKSSASSSAATSSSASASSSTAATNASAQSAEKTLVSWQGALVDGTLVDFISSDDGKNGGFVLTKSNSAEPKRWLGAMTIAEDGKVSITDDTSKETISFTRTGVTTDGAVTIDVEGYGKGALVPMTAADWQRVAEAEKLAETLGTVVNWVGVFENGSLVVYLDNESGSKAAVAITPKNSTETKIWTGSVTTADNNKVTVTDDKTKQEITLTVTKVANDGSLAIESEGYGKGVLVQMTVADYMALDELLKNRTW